MRKEVDTPINPIRIKRINGYNIAAKQGMETLSGHPAPLSDRNSRLNSHSYEFLQHYF